MGTTSIVSAYPNDIRRQALLASEDPSLSPHNKAVMAGTKMGSGSFVSSIIEEDERLCRASNVRE